jgi:hypothetical protein
MAVCECSHLKSDTCDTISKTGLPERGTDPKVFAPANCLLTQDIVLDFEVSPSLANTIILLLKNYFESAKAQDKAFGDVILDHITRLSDAQFSEKWFDLARAIGPSADVALRTTGSAVSSRRTYLSVGAAALDLQRVKRVLLCTMMGWINIVKLYCTPPVVAVEVERKGSAGTEGGQGAVPERYDIDPLVSLEQIPHRRRH